MEQEKEEMKQSLQNWGMAMEKYKWKEEELERAMEFYEAERKLWGESEEELERIERERREEMRRLRIEMVEILREKAWIDRMIKYLPMEEVMFLQLRFEKGYGFDYIMTKMHRSRATLFRMQDKILQELITIHRGGEKR